ncbi:MAG: SDR family oxidoreductase, partial [Thermoleophilia bacterium]|nr:SDR family oxidoreductase [Thermoleophilia bacterium]
RKQVKSVSGQVVAITGGAQGIVKSTAAALIRRGARVAIGDLNQELAEKTATELGGNCVAFELDVTSRPSFEAFLDAAEAELGPVDVVVNNAGIMPLNMLSDEPDEIAKLQIDINLHGVIFGTKIAIARMVPRAKGHIVNIASQAGKAGFPGGATYCATKHAVVGLSEAARLELRDTGVEVSVVMPAVVNTELGSGLHEARGVKTLEPEEVAEAVVEAIETNRFDVWVPKSTAAIATVMNIVPRRGREAIARLLKADDILATPDEGARAAYEDRAAGSRSDEAAAEAAESEEAAKKG